ncbi:hypothetical protein N7535_002485 [Penicillium sp. DV-2018c]|nr:hypothetical protein N7461_001832 [Penicillium sp. DV-2018c]KAJ5575559.1 hypothetical protein N7535_002485 [Penicillium sp. DV-2018c]
MDVEPIDPENPSLKYEELVPKSDVAKEIGTYMVGEGEVLNDRYHILQKIGYGPTSTLSIPREPRMVVLKIYVVDYILNTYGRINPPKSYNRLECPLYEVSDRFTIKGSQGPHICVVHEAPAMTFGESHAQPGDKLDLGPGKQLELTAETNRPRVAAAAGPRNDQLIAPMILPGDGVPLTFDFPGDDDGMSEIAEDHMRAPEEVLRSKINYKTDIWAVGHTAWRLAKFPELINGRNADGAFDDRVHVAELVALLGPPSAAFREKTQLGSMFWDRHGNWTGQAPIPDRSLEGLTGGDGEGEEVKGFLQWVRKALQWDPEDRPTALGLLRHDWMYQKTEAVEAGGEDMEVSLEDS